MKTQEKLKSQVEALKSLLKKKFEVETVGFLVLTLGADKLRKATRMF
jgi:hypothetical protein